MMRKAPLVLMLVCLALAAPAVEAKNRDKAWEFGASLAHIDGSSKQSVENTLGTEVRFGYNFTPKVTAEVWVDLASGEIASNDTSFVRTALVVTANFLTDRETRWVPFISA